LNKSLSKNICVLIVSKTNLNKRICRHNKHNDSDVMSEAEEEEEEEEERKMKESYIFFYSVGVGWNL